MLKKIQLVNVGAFAW